MAFYPAPNVVTIFNEPDYPTSGLTSSTYYTTQYFNSVGVLGSTWDTSATTHTITSTALSYLGTNYSVGELTVYVNNSAGNQGLYKGIMNKLGSSVQPQLTQTTMVSNMTTFTVAATGSSNSLTITVSPTAKISWIYIGT
jgi:uncharacterized protein YdaL